MCQPRRRDIDHIYCYFPYTALKSILPRPTDSGTARLPSSLMQLISTPMSVCELTRPLARVSASFTTRASPIGRWRAALASPRAKAGSHVAKSHFNGQGSRPSIGEAGRAKRAHFAAAAFPPPSPLASDRERGGRLPSPRPRPLLPRPSPRPSAPRPPALPARGPIGRLREASEKAPVPAASSPRDGHRPEPRLGSAR